MEIISILDNLTEKQKEKVKDKKAVSFYYEWYDQMQVINLPYEKRGILLSALCHYSMTLGTEPLPEELEKAIEADVVLTLLFNLYMNTTINAVKQWCNTHHPNKKNESEDRDEIKRKEPEHKVPDFDMEDGDDDFDLGCYVPTGYYPYSSLQEIYDIDKEQLNEILKTAPQTPGEEMDQDKIRQFLSEMDNDMPF